MGAFFKLEPTLILQALNAGVNAAQVIAVPMPAWAHAVVLGVSGTLTALLNRAVVTPALPAVAPDPWTAGP